jgi:ribonuclease Z
MKLDFLGTGAGNFRGSRRQPSSALLDTILLDCGAGATGRLHDIGRFGDVEAVLISHLHSDHVAGLFDFLLHTFLTRRDRPLTIVSPPGLGEVLRSVIETKGTVVNPADVYPLRVVEGEAIDLTVGGWRIRSFVMDHTLMDLGYLLASNGVSAFYTGDTREPSAAGGLRADYLIHEATFSDRDGSLARAYGHSTGTQAAQTAARMGARRLWLSHIGDRPNSEAEISLEARRVFPDSEVVEDRASFQL